MKANLLIQSRTVYPSKSIQGKLRVPGDKSISHRVSLLAGISSGRTTIRGFLHSEDCLNTLRAMESLGACVRQLGDGEIEVEGTSGLLVEPTAALDLGNSGTGVRLLSGLLAGYPVQLELTGDDSLCSRPMQRIKEPLEKMGAGIDLTGEKGTAPIRLNGGAIQGITYELPVASAQVKSCVLLAGMNASGATTVREPLPTRDHTERMLKAAGLPVRVDGLKVSIDGAGPGTASIPGRTWNIPGDFSSAAFWLMAVAGREGSTVKLEQVGLNPRRTAFLRVLERMGAQIEVEWTSAGDEFEPRGNICIVGQKLRSTEVAGEEIPNLIDELPLVAVAGAIAEGETVIRDAGELRIKETDRIQAMASNLQQLGIDVEEQEDGMRIRGGRPWTPSGAVRSYGDHRMAMSMAILALYGKDPVRIDNTACTETSYPGFWNDLRKIGGHVN